jgi:hypothetical protein
MWKSGPFHIAAHSLQKRNKFSRLWKSLWKTVEITNLILPLTKDQRERRTQPFPSLAQTLLGKPWICGGVIHS